MKCPNCEHENTAEAKFCDQCGAELARACTSCGRAVPTTAKFCAECGHPVEPAGDPRFASPKSYTPQHLADQILSAPVGIDGERKQVTVLFADIKGSMELFADHDPEAAKKFFDPVLECMIEAVHRYEGTVNRVMGDGIMAVFGAPIAREDHAVRACYAALRMQETVTRYSDLVHRSHGLAVEIRVGINSGEIVVYSIGDDLHMDYTVVGQTANLAARMEQMAKAGSVLTTAATFQLAEGYIAMKQLGPMQVKGLTEPVQLYEVTGAGVARTRLQVAAGRGLTRFVGRELELEQLRRVQHLAGRGQGQMVAIVGEAGVGKSRLVREFVHSQYTAEWLVLESKSAPYGRATPYLPVIELLIDYFKISADDSTRSIREKVTEKVLTLDQSLRDAIPPLLDLLDSLDENHPFRSLDPVQHRQYTYQAVVRLLLSESRVRPVVAVFEELHWNDSLSLGLLNEVVVAAQNTRLLLMICYRPEYRDQWRNRPNYHQLHLDPLASESLAEFLQALLGSDPSLDNLKRFLVERSNGNPFFVEEIVRSLIDTGVLEGSHRLARPFSSSEIPPTVQAVLAARIDALPAAEKHLLEEAAVIGPNVPFALLHAISRLKDNELRRLLDNLQAAEFLYLTQLFPDPEYAFKHALTHEVAYSGVLHERRRDIHACVVTAIEKLYADRLGEQVERLAHHAVRGERQEKAVHYLRQAGAKAVGRSALSEARACFEHALGILKLLPESEAALENAFEIRLELRPVLRQLGEVRQMLEHLREAEALAERLKDDHRRGQVCGFMTTVLSTLDELEEAVMTGTRAVDIAQQCGDLGLGVVATSCLEEAYYYRGEYEHVVEIATGSLAALPVELVHEHFGLALPASVFGRAWLIMSLAELGRFAEAAKYEAEAIQLAEQTKHAHTIGWAHLAASMLHLFKGDWVKARLLVDQWLNIPGTLEVAVLLPWAVASSAWTLAQIGEADEALSRVREGERLLELQETRGIVGHSSWAYHALSRALLLIGRLDQARRLGCRSIELARRQPGFKAHALLLLGELATHPDEFDAESGLARYRQALALAELHAMRPLVAHCRLGLGKLFDRIGQPDHARENMTAAAMLYREMDMHFWLEAGWR
ncbi:Double zinc ribbon [Bradyrhizobium lablabi]|uniref:Double zinc ribbon n=1 Tax=Bradyrhizobium lablabi TaxID=722472 RepID=A0A1M6TQQ6_9BRAD|nr:adenylate/guanylate cyclase domain-containing protein [Bradyrhizobium lablabi]SHK59266.1 Double zinc ribbon [Bradyrhizobium lablabi]